MKLTLASHSCLSLFPRKVPQALKKKRTMFTEKQLAYLNFLKNKNPYPTVGLQREMASKMELHLTVLQVRRQAPSHQATSFVVLLQLPSHVATLWTAACQAPLSFTISQSLLNSSSLKFYSHSLRSWSRSALPRRTWLHLQGLSGATPESLVCADPLIPAFQLSIRPALKALTDHSLGHKMVHFGCCQDLNIYCLYPIVES
ncbi:LOW QUALITY PROTEIN: divergent paired-related homeobox [Bubalus bubalis]|uniref:LOW QUALITY PROTEIN: divergent paired-related homeobox n=1 Tax=Bubalus bubalis TaxID=89462 RepID=UPI001E1B75DC|nr:LOW QUALITY PROTEIN: divergent paired-related homeobox [Bubalus bubalis]